MRRVVLDINNLTKTFGQVTILKNISLQVEMGTITLITGENGAGKTSLFNCITALERSTSGSIRFEDTEISRLNALSVARLGIVRMYQQPRLFSNMAVWENLVVSANNSYARGFFEMIFHYKQSKNHDLRLKKRALDILKRFGLGDLENKQASQLSYGQKKLVAFCMIIMAEARLALLDEPFAGLIPAMIDRLSAMIVNMKEEGISFMVIEHNIKKALPIADRHLVIDEGKIVGNQSTIEIV